MSNNRIEETVKINKDVYTFILCSELVMICRDKGIESDSLYVNLLTDGSLEYMFVHGYIWSTGGVAIHYSSYEGMLNYAKEKNFDKDMIKKFKNNFDVFIGNAILKKKIKKELFTNE